MLQVDEVKEAVQALHDSGRGEVLQMRELFHGATAYANAAVAEWVACDLGLSITADDCTVDSDYPLGYVAAAQGCVRLLQHLCERGFYTAGPADMRAVLLVNRHGDPGTLSVDVVRWLHAHGVHTHGPTLEYEELDPKVEPHQPAGDALDFLTFEAARVGALELLQVLVEECGAHWTESALVAAAEEGHMDVLRWAIGKHFSCAADTSCAAVRLGCEYDDYRPLALLHSAKRPWNETVWAAAAPNKAVRAWLKARGCPASQTGPAAGAGTGAGAPAAALLA